MTNYYGLFKVSKMACYLIKVSKMTIIFMTCSESEKWLILIFTCSKLSKWLVDLGLRLAVLNNYQMCVCVSLRLVDVNNYSDVV